MKKQLYGRVEVEGDAKVTRIAAITDPFCGEYPGMDHGLLTLEIQNYTLQAQLYGLEAYGYMQWNSVILCLWKSSAWCR